MKARISLASDAAWLIFEADIGFAQREVLDDYRWDCIGEYGARPGSRWDFVDESYDLASF